MLVSPQKTSSFKGLCRARQVVAFFRDLVSPVCPTYNKISFAVGQPLLGALINFMLLIFRFVLVLCALGLSSAGAFAVDAPLGPVKFFADLSADEQSATTISPGKGRADFSLERDNLRLSWKVTYNKMTSAATGAHIHGPQRPGPNAGIQVDLAPKGLKLQLEGSAILTDAQLEYLLAGRMYVNIHSVTFPLGELRGQIQRLAPRAQ